MKKLLLFVILLLSVAFLGGCNLENLINNQDGDPENGLNNGDGGEGDNGNNKEPQDEIAGVKEDYDTKEIDNKLDALRLQNGFFIKYEYAAKEEEEAITIAYGAKGNVYYFAVATDEAIIDLSDDSRMVTYETYYGKWSSSVIDYSDDFSKEMGKSLTDTYAVLAKNLCSMYDSVTEGDFVKTADTVAGRACDKYTTVLTDGVLLKHIICVDKATGVCLKWEVEAVSASGSSFARFECKEFKTNYDIAIPTVSNED